MKKIVQECEINYEKIGEGIPVICLHGFFVDSRLMKGCLEPTFTLEKGFKRIYIDLVGMGKTQKNEKINGSDDLLSLLIEFIDLLLGENPFILMGESFGGYLSLALVRHYGCQILGVFLICPCVVGDRSKRILPKRRTILVESVEILDGENARFDSFLEMAVQVTPTTWQRYWTEVLPGVESADEAFLENFEKNYELSDEPFFTQINFPNPTVFLLGRQDHIVGYEDALALRNSFPNGTFLVLNGAGHNLQIEEPEVFDSCLCNFLKRI